MTKQISLEIIRHSTAHLMAQAISRCFPEQNIQYGIGPTIENGFYYDIQMEYNLTEKDLKKIEKMMKSIIKEKIIIERTVLSKDQAIQLFTERGQLLKLELIEKIPAEEDISCYKQGNFIDLCRGPHVSNTKELSFNFKLLNVTGAYWLGDSNNQMLQRIYAICFDTKEEVKDYFHFLEEAKKRDHRKLGKELDLFLFDTAAPGSPFFMPKGAIIYNQLIEYIRNIYHKFDYDEVITPQILDSKLWHTSGHYQHYKENMYFSNIDDREFAVKPMNCPCHMLMYSHKKYSYRDLPLRFADFGRIHRYEKAGAVSGLTRVRTFCQDDAHIFLTMQQIQQEISSLMNMFFITYKHFEFKNIVVNLSTRPKKKAGDDATWDIAENALMQALKNNKLEYKIKEGDGAFYGPKIDIEISDALNRLHQLGTIQLDFQLPERFDLSYTAADGSKQRPVVIHRALLGSLERFLGIYIEHTAGVFPFWIAPIQLIIIPVNNNQHVEYSLNLKNKLSELNLRVKLDDRNETLGLKTRQAQKAKTPFMIVIGDKEVKSDIISIRAYGEKETKTMDINDLIQFLLELNKKKIPIVNK